MKKATLLFALLFFVFASIHAQMSQAYFKPAVTVDQGEVDDCSFEEVLQTNDLRETQTSVEETSGTLGTSQPPNVYAPLWGDDLLVTNECPVVSSVTRLAFDYDDNGYIYVMLLANHGTSDTIWTYRSTDMGYTWERGWDLWLYPSDVDVISYDMRVQGSDANPYIYQIAIYAHAGDTLATYRRVKADSSTENWYDFTAYNDIKWVEMDITDEADPHVYLVFNIVATPYGLRRAASADGGANWTTGSVSSTQKTVRGYDLCAGPGPYAYLVYNYVTGDAIRIFRYTDYFTTSQGFLTIGNDANFDYSIISSARYNAFPSNFIHMVYQSGHVDNPATRSMEYTSSDGGQNWSTAGFFFLGDVHAVSPFVACTRYGTSDQFIGIATQYWTDADSTAIGYKYDQTQPWNNLGFKNQYRATTGIAPQGNYVNSGLGGGIAYVYRQYASNNIWYDRASHYNAVEENPSPVTGITYNPNQIMFSFSLPNNTSGTIAVYDMLGRNVVTLYSGDFNAGENSFTWDYKADGISSGNYFMMLSVPGKTLSEKISIVN